MKLLLGLLSDTGDISMMRFLSLLNIVAAIVIALYSVFNNKNLSEATVLCSVFLGAGIGGKVIQKVSETKNG